MLHRIYDEDEDRMKKDSISTIPDAGERAVYRYELRNPNHFVSRVIRKGRHPAVLNVINQRLNQNAVSEAYCKAPNLFADIMSFEYQTFTILCKCST